MPPTGSSAAGADLPKGAPIRYTRGSMSASKPPVTATTYWDYIKVEESMNIADSLLIQSSSVIYDDMMLAQINAPV